MKKYIVAAVCAASMLCAPQSSFADSKANWDTFSTVLSVGLMGGAAAISFDNADKQGLMEYAKGMGSTILVTQALKSLISEQRPDGSGDNSFPSGHTSVAFAAATYLSIRYKDNIGSYAPLLFGAATLTGVSRVKADKHYTQDVIAGALIGAGLAYVFTTPIASDMQAFPAGDGFGANFVLKF